MIDSKDKVCSFCGKGKPRVVWLIEAPDSKATICDNCVRKCDSLLAGSEESVIEFEPGKFDK